MDEPNRNRHDWKWTVRRWWGPSVTYLLASVLNLSQKQSTIAVDVLLALCALWTWLVVRSLDIISKLSGRKKVFAELITGLAVAGAFSWSILFFKPNQLPVAYPWVSTRHQIAHKGSVKAVVLHVFVREYPRPASEERAILSPRSLHNLHLIISTPLVITKEGGSRWCVLSDVQFPEWNNDAGARLPLGILDLTNDTTLLQIQAAATDAQWMGTVLIRRNGAQLDWEESLGGWTVSQSGESSPMLVTEVRKSGQTTYAGVGSGERISADLLKSYGVPLQTGTALPCCPALQRF